MRNSRERNYSSPPSPEAELSKKTYYEILGVAPEATQEQIKEAFLNMARESHPDRGGDTKKFQFISEAYTTLKDSKKRDIYDLVNGHRWGKWDKQSSAPKNAGRNPSDSTGSGGGNKTRDYHYEPPRQETGARASGTHNEGGSETNGGSGRIKRGALGYYLVYESGAQMSNEYRRIDFLGKFIIATDFVDNVYLLYKDTGIEISRAYKQIELREDGILVGIDYPKQPFRREYLLSPDGIELSKGYHSIESREGMVIGIEAGSHTEFLLDPETGIERSIGYRKIKKRDSQIVGVDFLSDDEVVI